MIRLAARGWLALTLAASSLAAEFEDHAARAIAAREQGRASEAIEAYRAALAEKPDWPEGLWFLAATLYQEGQIEEARPVFESFVAVSPETGPGWIMLGLSEFKLGDYDAAFDHLRKGRSLGEGANKGLLSTGNYYLALLMNRFGEWEAASQLLLPFAQDGNESSSVVEAFGLSVLRKTWLPSEIPGEERDAITKAGRAAFFLGARRAAEGRREMELLLAERPDDPDVRYAYATMLIQSDPEAAKEELAKVLEARPDDYQANLVMGTLLSKERKYNEALSLLERARAKRPGSILVRYQIASAYLATGEADAARELLEAIVNDAYEFTGAHVSLATAYFRLGRKEDAEREREIVRELNARRQAGEPGAEAAARADAAITENSP